MSHEHWKLYPFSQEGDEIVLVNVVARTEVADSQVRGRRSHTCLRRVRHRRDDQKLWASFANQRAKKFRFLLLHRDHDISTPTRQGFASVVKAHPSSFRVALHPASADSESVKRSCESKIFLVYGATSLNTADMKA